MSIMEIIKKHAENDKIVRGALEKTAELEGTCGVPKNYVKMMFDQRLPETGMGSVYEGYADADELATAFWNALWVAAENENVAPNCRAFKTVGIKGGLYGMVPVADQPDDAKFVIEDYKNTGKVSLVLHTDTGRIPADETWVILGPAENGDEVVYTFHPGEPVPHATTSTEELPVGTKLTKQQALELGFNMAKVV